MSHKRRNDDGLVDGWRRHDAVLDAEVERIKRLSPAQAERAMTALIARMTAFRDDMRAQRERLEAQLAEIEAQKDEA